LQSKLKTRRKEQGMEQNRATEYMANFYV